MTGDLRCVDGRLFRHDPQFDDPDLETDVGECPDCSGDGCLDEFEHEGREMTAQNCSGCRYWSEMLAQSIGGGPIQAYCLATGGSQSGKWTTGRMICEAWANNDLGAVDDPAWNLGSETASDVYARYDEE